MFLLQRCLHAPGAACRAQRVACAYISYISITGTCTHRPETASALLAALRRLLSHSLLCSVLTCKGQCSRP